MSMNNTLKTHREKAKELDVITEPDKHCLLVTQCFENSCSFECKLRFLNYHLEFMAFQLYLPITILVILVVSYAIFRYARMAQGITHAAVQLTLN